MTTANFIIDLEVANGCQADQVTPTSAAISDLTYYLNVDGVINWVQTWSSSVAGCPLTYEIGRIVSSAEQALTGLETAALMHSTVDGSLTLISADYALDGEVWEIKLYKKSTYSIDALGEGVYQFVLTLRDICWDSNLTPAVFSASAYSFTLYEA